LNIFMRDFSLSSCPQQSASLLASKSYVCFYVLNCEENFSFFVIQSGLARVFCIHIPNSWLSIEALRIAHTVNIFLFRIIQRKAIICSNKDSSLIRRTDVDSAMLEIILQKYYFDEFSRHTLSSACRLHFPTLYLPCNVSVPSGRLSTAWKR
jgi:hypothetical protein